MTAKIFRNSFFAGLLVLLAAAVLFLSVMYSKDTAQTFEKLEAETAAIAPAAEQLGLSYLRTLETDSRITWIAADGAVLYDNAAAPDEMDNHLAREEITAALASGTGRATRYSKTGSSRTHYYARRLADGSVLRAACTQSSVTALARSMLTPVAWIVLLIVVLCAAISFRVARQITRPINTIDLDAPDEKHTYPELRPLAARIREQNRTIHRQLSELSRRQRELAAITEQMQEGFLLLSCAGDVLSGNHSARAVLALPEGTVNFRTLDEPEFIRAAETALSGERAETMLHRKDAVWRLSANPVLRYGRVTGAVVLLLDVTEREEREALRREFSANVSHELKTPLTSISGFAELMKEGLVPPERMREFSADIYRESSRMIALVDDIMNLSRLDEGAALPRTAVDLYALAAGVKQSLQSAAERCDVTLRLLGQSETVEGNEPLLREMLYNLCDNAIKYNVPGGSVTVNVWRSGAHPCLSVADTGIGIPQAHQERIFERFYRVDKSHSKEVGGTGLGLSIVKHAVQYHGAHLELKSAPGKGTAITVTF